MAWQESYSKFKNLNVTDWEANNFNTYIVQSLRSNDNLAIKFDQLIECNSKNISHAENEVGRRAPDFFAFFQKSFIWGKASGHQISFNIFLYLGRPSFGHVIKTNYKISVYDREMCCILIWFLIRSSGTGFSTTFCVWLFKKHICHATFYYVTKFHCLVAFTSRDIRQYVYCSYLFPGLSCHKCWN